MRGWKWGVFAGVWIACVGCNKATESFEIKIQHVGGKPYANQPVVPFASDSIGAGWWSHDAIATLGDTIWTDAHGTAILPCPRDRWDGLICSLRAFQETPRRYALRFTTPPEPSNITAYSIPGVAFIRFVGNRQGNAALNGFWLFHAWETPSLEPERWITPGEPPAPSLLFHHWIHPDESLPTTRRHVALSPNGEVDTLPALFILEDMMDDTTHCAIHL